MRRSWYSLLNEFPWSFPPPRHDAKIKRLGRSSSSSSNSVVRRGSWLAAQAARGCRWGIYRSPGLRLISAANLGTNYSSLLPWCTRSSWQQTPAKLIQILPDQLQPNSQKITWLLTTSEMLQKIYHKSWSTKSSAKKGMKTHTHTHSLSLSLSTWCDLEIHKKNTNKISLSLSLSISRFKNS